MLKSERVHKVGQKKERKREKHKKVPGIACEFAPADLCAPSDWILCLSSPVPDTLVYNLALAYYIFHLIIHATTPPRV